jgi:cellobiose phosphorylase
VLHVALGELSGGGAEQVFARQIRPGGGESDDRAWLAYTVAQYVETTKDMLVL